MAQGDEQLNTRITVGFKYKGHKVFGDISQMSFVPGSGFFLILIRPKLSKTKNNITTGGPANSNDGIQW